MDAQDKNNNDLNISPSRSNSGSLELERKNKKQNNKDIFKLIESEQNERNQKNYSKSLEYCFLIVKNNYILNIKLYLFFSNFQS